MALTHFIQSSDPNLYFIESSYIYVFPCAYRGVNENGKPYDPEARLNTEKSLLKLSGLKTNNSYLIGWHYTGETTVDRLDFVLHGYHFSIKLSELELTGEAASTTLKYVGIKLLSFDLVDGSEPTEILKDLTNSSNTPTASLDTIINNSAKKYFTGIAFATSLESFTGSGWYTLELTTKEDFNTHKNRFGLKYTDIQSKKVDVAITGDLIAGSGSHSIVSLYDDANIPNIANNTGAIATGHKTLATGLYSHAEGYNVYDIDTLEKVSGQTSKYTYLNSLAIKPGKKILDYTTREILASIINVDTTNKIVTLDRSIGDGTITCYITAGAFGMYSHVENGYNTAAAYAHAEGGRTVAFGLQSHAEGNLTIANGANSHAEGDNTLADGNGAHAEGENTIAQTFASHAEGCNTVASGEYSHAEGYNTVANGAMSHAEGNETHARGEYSHTEGGYNTAYGNYSHVEGFSTSTSINGINAHAEGQYTQANGRAAHAEGGTDTAGPGQIQKYTVASGAYSHAEGESTEARGRHSHTEGSGTLAYGINSHAEGSGTGYSLNTVSITLTNAEEQLYTTTNNNAQIGDVLQFSDNYYAKVTHTSDYTINLFWPDEEVPIGSSTVLATILPSIAYGSGSHTEGNNTIASGSGAHAEGNGTKASGDDSHAEGYQTQALESSAHAEGRETKATNYSAHAEGRNTTASGGYSHAEGYYTIANHRAQHVFGEYNIADASTEPANIRGNYVEIIGNGTGISASSRSNARTLDWDGNEWLAGGLTTEEDILAKGDITAKNNLSCHQINMNNGADTPTDVAKIKYDNDRGVIYITFE